MGINFAMGRRSLHTPEELRSLILASSRTIIEKHGLPGLSAREIARLISYSPGTLYNMFENIDDVLLTLQVEMLQEVSDQLTAVPKGATAREHIDALTAAYVDYAIKNRHLWNMLFAHLPPSGATIPPALHDHVLTISATISGALAPLMGQSSAQEKDHAARALWAGVHGITAIAVTEKAPVLSASNALEYAHTLTSTYIDGLVARQGFAVAAQ